MIRAQLTTAAIVALLALPGAMAQSGGRSASRAAKAPDIGAAVDQVVARTNEFRRSEGHSALPTQPTLIATARAFADYMARTDRYGHEADGSTPSQRAASQGYDYCIVAENIAYNYHSGGFTSDELATALVEGWKNSPTHRAAMLDADVTETGVAIARSARSGRYYAVQMFGRPRTASFEFQVANRAGAIVRYVLDGRAFELPPRSTRVHQQCRVGELVVTLPDATRQTVRPIGGERYSVVNAGNGQLTLQSE